MAIMPIMVFNDISMNKPKTAGWHCWSMDMQVTLEQASSWGPSWHLQGVTDGMVVVEEVMVEVVEVEVDVQGWQQLWGLLKMLLVQGTGSHLQPVNSKNMISSNRL